VSRGVRLCDYLIAFEGETALDALLSALEAARRSMPCRTSLRRRGRLRKTATRSETIDALPTPDYRGCSIATAYEPVFR
jgi:hypothetical protein